MTYASRKSEITLILLMIFSVCYNGNITYYVVHVYTMPASLQNNIACEELYKFL